MRTVAGYHTPEVDAVTTEAPGTACGMHEENPVHAHLVWLEEQKVQVGPRLDKVRAPFEL